MSTPPTTTGVSRRRVLAGLGTTAIGATGLLALTTDRTRAAVTLGEFSLAGDTATLAEPPARVDVHVSGEFEVTMANGPPEMVELTTQARVGPEPLVDDIGTVTRFDTASGTFSGTFDLLQHKDVTADYLMPADDGGSKTTAVTVREVVTVVDGGSIVTESWAEASAELVVDHDGAAALVGGSGTLEIVSV